MWFRTLTAILAASAEEISAEEVFPAAASAEAEAVHGKIRT